MVDSPSMHCTPCAVLGNCSRRDFAACISHMNMVSAGSSGATSYLAMQSRLSGKANG